MYMYNYPFVCFRHIIQANVLHRECPTKGVRNLAREGNKSRERRDSVTDTMLCQNKCMVFEPSHAYPHYLLTVEG